MIAMKAKLPTWQWLGGSVQEYFDKRRDQYRQRHEKHSLSMRDVGLTVELYSHKLRESGKLFIALGCLGISRSTLAWRKTCDDEEQLVMSSYTWQTMNQSKFHCLSERELIWITSPHWRLTSQWRSGHWWKMFGVYVYVKLLSSVG